MKKTTLLVLLMAWVFAANAATFDVQMPPQNAVNCASDDEACTIPDGISATVWYGAGIQWLPLYNQVGTVGCDADTFGSVLVSTANTCVYSEPALTAGIVMQAEDASLVGATVENLNSGAEGEYIDFQNPSGDELTWTINTTKAGYAPLDIRYALGGDSSRQMTLKVNGEVVSDTVVFAPTQTWDIWANYPINVDLGVGVNTVTLETTGETGPSIDSLTVVGSANASVLDVEIERVAIGAEEVVALHEAEDGTSDTIIDLREQTVTISNITDQPLLISSLAVAGDGFSLADATQSDGATLQPGESIDVGLAFNQSQRSVFTGQLVIMTDNTVPSVHQVPLRGLWNPGVSGGSEPTIADITNLFGWANKADGTIFSRDDINDDGVPTLIEGEPTIEIDGAPQQAYYFEAADPSQPVTIQQIGAFHINGSRSVLQAWGYDYNPELGQLNEAAAYANETDLLYIAHDAKQGNTVLQYQLEYEPELELTRPLVASIDAIGPFAFTLDARHTDPARNDGYQAVRILEVFDQKAGLRLENSYLLTMDYAGPGANYDYNDNVYIVTNIKPFDGEVSNLVPPNVTLSQPVATQPGFVSGSIEAVASDEDGTIEKVEFYFESNLLATVTTAPYVYEWEDTGNGVYPIYARAYDNDGSITDSNVVEVVIDDTQANTAPSISLAQPVASPGNVSGSITATAADIDGSITKVEFFYNGDNLLETLTAAPYTLQWAGVPDGTYLITAKATDDLGAESLSNVVEVTVDNAIGGDNQAPIITLNDPVATAGNVSGSMEAIASDSDGSISKVEFYYNGDNLLETLTSAPYVLNWDSVPNGSYTVTAKAFDDDGAETLSNAVLVVVDDTVGAGNEAPEVTISVANASAGNVSGRIEAAVSDSDGSISKVEFYLNGDQRVKIGFMAPFFWEWSDLPDGIATITAKAVDNDGAETSSNTIAIEVNNAL